MREIKFRAFHKIGGMKYSFDGWNSEVCVLTDVWKYIEDYGYTVMQYTGLKDKNGKEIYEGDVIKKGECVYKVAFGSGAFIFQGISHRNSGYFTHSPSDEFEILGNIYENPELIKK